MTSRELQPYRGTIAWLLQRVTALLLVFLIPLKIYTGYASVYPNKVPWFRSGSAAEVHANNAVDIALLFCVLLHAFYGVRVILIDFGWIREDRFFWGASATAAVIFVFAVYYLYVH